MNTGKYVFSQVMSLLDPNYFIRCVKKYNGNYKVKHFTCWHQLMCLLFGQLSHRESLSDLIMCLSTQRNQLNKLGIRHKRQQGIEVIYDDIKMDLGFRADII